MKVMIFTSSPNVEGLTAACGHAAKAGAEAADAEVLMVNLNQLQIAHCQACGNGWGQCRNQHECKIEDDFEALHASMADIDAYVMVTPVYWGDMSESAKAFLDRVRRSEAFKKENSFFENKPVIAVAAAGGSGNGLTSCLSSLERFLQHVRAEKFDLIGITQKSRGYKLDTIHEATKAMISYWKQKAE